ncbi:hypothetical protein Edno5_0011 [Edwardsiella phage Edno5]|uniref:Uncharacterized protein n=1 Tax=Edwardsiella phage Edno5 TaxID=2419942 RepID=A0A3G3BYC1_9CAUD|nr:hypothetical protein [Edwardsiella anguillarum]YP_010052822.1 tail completion or Neck1 protein [Edwardsiella phage Edno5]AYP69210.1 hypothetical protein Edno5_0011 [Edwardsiella phage Edno5]RFT04030.1 hypothetical protein CGL57_09925 [Edwardsiella anguillarum]
MTDKVMDALDAAERALQSLQLKVGFIDGRAYDNGMPIATVAAIQEYGDPANNIPARPFFRKAIWANESTWNEQIANGIRNGEPVHDVLSALGERVVGDVVSSIAQLMDPPLSPVTIKRRRTRKERRNESTKPLVDTATMNHDVHFEVGEIEHSEPGE